LTKRFGRVQAVTKDSMQYFYTNPRNVTMQSGEQVVAADRSYTVMGRKLYGFPLESSCTYEVRYNYLPTSFTEQLDTAEVEWPDGFENAFVYEVVARALAPESSEKYELFHRLASNTYNDMRSLLKRQYVGPAVIQDLGDGIDEGGT
jgi:hypothetical protein